MEAYELDLNVVCWFSYCTDDRCLLAMGYQSAELQHCAAFKP